MTRIRLLLWLVLIVLVLPSCQEEPYDKYEPPEWLSGRLFEIIQEQDSVLGTFAKGLQFIGYDTIINKSGNFTVFAPSDEAFKAYFANNPKYASIEEMEGTKDLERLIKYHLVQNPWSKEQLRSLDIGGWIDTTALSNNEPRGFKRETLLRDDDVKYGVKRIGTNSEERLIIVDTLKSNWQRKVTTDARKYVPIFFQEYFNIYDLQSSDYDYYFGRPFEAGEIFYANAKIISDENFAENGFVYVIDRVVEPLDNAYQFMENDENDSYSEFIDLVNYFVDFEYNEQKTEQQPGFEAGLVVDSLFDLSYPELAVNINSEKVSPNGFSGYPEYYTITYHYGIAAPSNDALKQFDQRYFQVDNGWGSLEDAPIHIKRIVARSYLTNSPLYAKDIDDGFYNGEDDLVQLDQSVIEKRIFCSNSTFLGLNEAISPRAFTSVAGPVYLRRGYSKVMYAIERSGLLAALKRPNKDYMFFVASDASTTADSSLLYDSFNKRFTTIYIEGPGKFDEYRLNVDDLRTLLLNHIGAVRPRGLATKEFIPNLAGNYIVVNNTTGEISGTAPTKAGYLSDSLVAIPDIPSIISDDTDNGDTYDIKHWFSFESTGLGGQLNKPKYKRFFTLLQKADLAGIYNLYDNVILESEKYTILVPSNAALDSAKVDTLSKNDLRELLKLHFIEGDLIFTDGNKYPGYYTTIRNNTQAPGNIKVKIVPDIDIIQIIGKSGDVYAETVDSEDNNMIAARNIGDDSEQEIRIPQLQTYAVIHEIDKVLKLDELDTN